MEQLRNALVWLPMNVMPADRRDGRQVLLWRSGEAHLARWDPELDGWDTGYESDILGNPVLVQDPECWSDVSHPMAGKPGSPSDRSRRGADWDTE